jgi:uncharacterized protein with NRDE domain
MAIKHHPDYPLIIAANRDEFHRRPASEARFWDNNPSILAGRDLQAGGTWLGMTTGGRFAAVTNYHDQISQPLPPQSRGALVLDFLQSDLPSQEFAKHILKHGTEYQGFTLVFGTVDDLFYCSNRSNACDQIKKGVHGLSNNLFNDTSYKVNKSKEHLNNLLSAKDKVSSEDLFSILRDSTLQWQGHITEESNNMSPIFIKGQDFGTRCSTVILVNDKGNVHFSERTFSPDGTIAKTVQYNFTIESELRY